MLKPEHRIIAGIVVIIFSLMQIISMLSSLRFFVDITEKFYVILYLASTGLGVGIYFIVSIKYYVTRYFPDRRFAKPIVEDGTEPRDDSLQLQEDITDDATRITNFDIMKLNIALMIIAMFYVGYLVLFINSSNFKTPGFLIATGSCLALTLVLHFYSKKLRRLKKLEKLELETKKIPRPKSRDDQNSNSQNFQDS